MRNVSLLRKPRNKILSIIIEVDVWINPSEARKKINDWRFVISHHYKRLKMSNLVPVSFLNNIAAFKCFLIFQMNPLSSEKQRVD